MVDVAVPAIETLTPNAGDTVLSVQGGLVKRFGVGTGSGLAREVDLSDATDPDKGAGGIGYRGRNTYERLSATLYPEDLGAVGDGVTDDSAAWGEFLDELIASGVRGKCQHGARYNVAGLSRTLSEGQSINLDMNGATFVQTTNATVLSLLNSGTVSSVSSVTEVSYNLGNGATSTRVMQVSSAGHPFTEAGQIGKIFSDDVVPDSDGANQFCGEFFVVGAVIDADNFVTTGVFDEAYATTVRVVKPSNASVRIDNLAGESTWQDSITASFATIQGFIRPVFGGVMRARDINAVFFNNTSNYFVRIEAVDGIRIKNRPDLGAYGYLVNDSAGYYTEVAGISCAHARHAYTTTTPTSAVAGDNKWWLRGRTIGSTVRNGRAHGCANAFDTHSPALRVRFLNCVPVDDFRGSDTGGAGIQIRGNDCRVIDCDVSQSKIGIAQSGASKTSDCTLTIEGLKYSGATGHTPVVINGSASYATTVNFNGEISTENGVAFDITNATVFVRDSTINMAPSTNGASVFSLNAGGQVRMKGGAIRFGAGNTHSLVAHNATGTTAYVDDVDVYGVSGRLSYMASSSAGYSIESRFRRMQLDASLPGVPFLGYEATTPKVSAEYTVGYATKPLANRVFTYGASGNQAIDLQFSADPSIFIRVEATTTGVVINSLSQGAFPGQRCTINNRNTSTSSIVVANNSSGLLVIGTSATLTAGRGITLVWDGANWRSSDQHA